MKTILRKIGRWLGFTLLFLIGLIVIVILLIRTQWAQNKIIGFATEYVSDKIETTVGIDKLYITFDGNILMEGLFVEGKQNDTIVYLHSLETGLSFSSLFTNSLDISEVEINGLHAIVTRKKSTEKFNFDFIVDAFASSASAPSSEQDSSASLAFSIGPIALTDIHIVYQDSVLGIDSHLDLASLVLKNHGVDFDKLLFDLQELRISEANIYYRQFAPFPISEDSASSNTTLPYIACDILQLHQVNFTYASAPDKLEIGGNLVNFGIDQAKITLARQEIMVNSISLDNSTLQVLTSETVPPPADTTNPTEIATNIIWPEWNIALNNLALNKNHIHFQQGNRPRQKGLFNAKNIDLKEFSGEINDLEYQPEMISVELQNFSFEDRSGFNLRQLSSKLLIDNQKASFQNTTVQTNNSELIASASVSYKELGALLNNPKEIDWVDAHVQKLHASIKDVFYFNDSLAKDSQVVYLSQYPLHMSTSISGNLHELHLHTFKANWLHNTQLSAKGHALNLTDTTNFSIQSSNITAHLTERDILLFTDSISGLPAEFDLKVETKGNRQKLFANISLNSDVGQAHLITDVLDPFDKLEYNGELSLKEIDLTHFAQQKDFMPLSVTLQFEGKGRELNTLESYVNFRFEQLIYKHYDYSAMQMSAEINDQKATLSSTYQDHNLDYKLKLKALIDTPNIDANLDFLLKGAALKNLNLTNTSTKLGTHIKAAFNGHPKNFDSKLSAGKTIVVKNAESFRLDTMALYFNTNDTSTAAKINSGVLNGNLAINSSLENALESLEKYFDNFGETDSVLVAKPEDLEMKAEFHLSSSMVLRELFIPDLQQLDTVNLTMLFKPSDDIMRLDLTAHEIVYANSSLKDLALNFNASKGTTLVHFGFERIEAGVIDLYQTAFDMELKNGKGTATFNMLDENSSDFINTIVRVNNEDDSQILTVDTNRLILTGKPWKIPYNNKVEITESSTLFSDFILSRNRQSISLNSFEENGIHKSNLELKDFDLATIFSVFNSNQSIITGTVNGSLVLTENEQLANFVGEASIDGLGALGNELGKLKLIAESDDGVSYTLGVNLNGNNTDLQIKGNYVQQEDSQLDLKLDINRIDLALLEKFAPKKIGQTEGYLSGKARMAGSTSEPDFTGWIEFHKAKLTLEEFGSSFAFSSDKLEFRDKKLLFHNFSVQDTLKNSARLDGFVNFTNPSNPEFDFSLNARNFQLINSTRKNSEVLYGKAIVNIDLQAKGTLNVPSITTDIEFVKGTEINYIVPPHEAQLEERQGIVRFANLKDSLDVLSTEDVRESFLSGMDLNAKLKIAPQTTFRIFIDEKSGDILELTGKANLNYTLINGGNEKLVGSYELSDGFYKLSFYELVQKKFDLLPGSKIVWNGYVMEGVLDLTAQYKLRTATTDLMTEVGMNQDPAALRKYKEKQPFWVDLNINGNLNRPQVSFDIDMPPSSRDVLGGSVYAKVQELNKNEAELNKQVLALIAFNTFIPAEPIDAGGGSTSDLARSSVSGILSSELNRLSSKYIEGIELNFDLDSYTDYQSGQAEGKTNLNVSIRQSLFSERLIVEVGSSLALEGSSQKNEVFGDVSIEYLLTENGRYRIKGFRDTGYQDLIEGQLTINGLAIMFNKDFDTLKELWQKDAKALEEENSDKKDD